MIHPRLTHTIPMQSPICRVAVLKGTDLDQPRNLAKPMAVA